MIIEADWHIKYLELARHISTWSKDPSTKVGAIAVGRIGQILATGYNGFPRGILDDSRLDIREKKYELVVHAEMNAIYNATHNGISLNGATLYVWGLPICVECAKGITQVGINQVVMKGVSNKAESKAVSSLRWKASAEKAIKIFDEARIMTSYIELDV
jgi:dCMP deaminase